MIFLPDNAGISPRKCPIALSQSSPQGTRVLQVATQLVPSCLQKPRSRGFSWLDGKVGGRNAPGI